MSTMGRIKTKLTKRISFQLLKAHREDFSEEFEHNKPAVTKHVDLPSKKMRNIIAGYLARLRRKEKLTQ